MMIYHLMMLVISDVFTHFHHFSSKIRNKSSNLCVWTTKQSITTLEIYIKRKKCRQWFKSREKDMLEFIHLPNTIIKESSLLSDEMSVTNYSDYRSIYFLFSRKVLSEKNKIKHKRQYYQHLENTMTWKFINVVFQL